MLLSLTSLRFFAAFSVFCWHAKWLPSFQLGYLGVSFFYVLSGFILTYTYEKRLRTFSKNEIGAFYVARFAKIYPVHLLTFLLALPLGLGDFRTAPYVFIKQAAACLTLTQGFHPDYCFSFNGVSWSLSDEAFFYALLPVMLLLLARVSHKLDSGRILALMIVGWLCYVILLLPRATGPDDWKLYVFPVVRSADFMLGVLLGRLFLTKSAPRLTKFGWSVMEVAALSLLLFAVAVSNDVPQSLRFSALYLPFWCLLIYTFAFQNGVVSRFLCHRTLVFLGEISFSFYMLHQLVLRYLQNLRGGPLHLPMPAIIWSLLALSISLLASSLMFRFYEEPVRKRIRAAFTNRADSVPQSMVNQAISPLEP